eukprot:Selendium_serpulae@DN2311_c0_g1_i2.p2
MGSFSSKNGKREVEDISFDMRIKAKEIRRQSERCAREGRSEEARVRQSIARGDKDGARILAENAIRKKNESLKYLKLASQFEAVASRLDSVATSQEMRKSIRESVPSLEKLLDSVDADKMGAEMASFEAVFETLDVRTEQLQTSIDATTATSTPQTEVDSLLCRLGEEHALDVSSMLSTTAIGDKQAALTTGRTEEAQLAARLNEL